MLLNLSGAHAPFFTRNLVVVTDDTGATGVGEVPGGEKIRQVLEDSRSLVEGEKVVFYKRILSSIRERFREIATRRAAGSDLRSQNHGSCGNCD